MRLDVIAKAALQRQGLLQRQVQPWPCRYCCVGDPGPTDSVGVSLQRIRSGERRQQHVLANVLGRSSDGREAGASLWQCHDRDELNYPRRLGWKGGDDHRPGTSTGGIAGAAGKEPKQKAGTLSRAERRHFEFAGEDRRTEDDDGNETKWTDCGPPAKQMTMQPWT